MHTWIVLSRWIDCDIKWIPFSRDISVFGTLSCHFNTSYSHKQRIWNWSILRTRRRYIIQHLQPIIQQCGQHRGTIIRSDTLFPRSRRCSFPNASPAFVRCEVTSQFAATVFDRSWQYSRILSTDNELCVTCHDDSCCWVLWCI